MGDGPESPDALKLSRTLPTDDDDDPHPAPVHRDAPAARPQPLLPVTPPQISVEPGRQETGSVTSEQKVLDPVQRQASNQSGDLGGTKKGLRPLPRASPKGSPRRGSAAPQFGSPRGAGGSGSPRGSPRRGSTPGGGFEQRAPPARRLSGALAVRLSVASTGDGPKSPYGRNASGLASGRYERPGTSENVRVMVRIRPFSEKEIELVRSSPRGSPGAYIRSVVDMPRSDQVQLLDHDKNYEVKEAYNFDTVLWSITGDQQKSPIGYADQERVYQETGALALETAWEGINSCIFAYGQTGSGKTHTMMGDPAQIAGEDGCEDGELGVIPRLCRRLFEDVDEKQEQVECTGVNKSIEVEAVFVEIYNETVYDLLGGPPAHIEHFTRQRFGKQNPGPASPGVANNTFSSPTRRGRGRSVVGDEATTPVFSTANVSFVAETGLKVREHPTEGPQIEGVTVCQPKSYKEIMEIINFGNRSRHVACTQLNDRSSRSHAMFRICLRQITRLEVERPGMGGPKIETSERRGMVNLVDLAGSENTKRSGAQGSIMTEAQNINLSLTTLRRVIDALIEGRANDTVVPYRESTLTWLLRQDLGGNSKCFMLATVSPHISNAHESMRTLKYAMRARSIVNNVKVNEDNTAKMFSDLEKRLWENQKKLKAEQISTEEKEELERQMEELKEAGGALTQRIEAADRKAKEEEQEIEENRKKREELKGKLSQELHALVEQAAQKREALTKHDELLKAQQEALLQHHFESIDALASEVSKTRQRRDALTGQQEEARRQYDAIQQRRSGREQMQEDEYRALIVRSDALKAAIKETRSTNHQGVEAQQDQQQKTKKASRALYDRQMEDAQDRHVGHKRRLEEEHLDKMTRAQQEHSEAFNEATQEMHRQISQVRRDFYDARERSLARTREVQDGETQKRMEVQREQRETQSVHAELRIVKMMANNSTDTIERRVDAAAGAVADLRRELCEAESGEAAEAAAIDAELDALQQQRECHVADAKRHTGCGAQAAERLRAMEAAWHKSSDRVSDFAHFLTTIGSQRDDIPLEWTSVDARRAVAAYAEYRRSLESVKPTGASPPRPFNRLLQSSPPRFSWDPAPPARRGSARAPANGGPAAWVPPLARPPWQKSRTPGASPAVPRRGSPKRRKPSKSPAGSARVPSKSPAGSARPALGTPRPGADRGGVPPQKGARRGRTPSATPARTTATLATPRTGTPRAAGRAWRPQQGRVPSSSPPGFANGTVTTATGTYYVPTSVSYGGQMSGTYVSDAPSRRCGVASRGGGASTPRPGTRLSKRSPKRPAGYQTPGFAELPVMRPEHAARVPMLPL